MTNQPWHPSLMRQKDATGPLETFQITDGTVSIVSHNRDAALWWAMLMIHRGLAPQILHWTSGAK